MAITKTELIEALGAFKELSDTAYDAKYVAKDGAKVLSTNDFTDALKAKLEGLNDEDVTRADIEAIFSGGASNAGDNP